jgi:hypothetical protein
MLGIGAAGKIHRDRPRRRRRRHEGAKTVKHAARWYHLPRGLLFARLVLRGGNIARHPDNTLEHVDKAAGERQIGPARIGGDVKQYDHAFAAARGGNKRRAVGE